MAIIKKVYKQEMLERLEKQEPSSTVDGNVNWRTYGEQYEGHFKN